MDQIYVFLIHNDVRIYILSALGLFWYTVQLWQARRHLRQAMFRLEQERGQYQQRTALTFIVIFMAIIAALIYVNLKIAPTLPPELLRPATPTPNVFATPFSPPAAAGTPQPQRTATLDVAPTVTLRSQAGNVPFPEIEQATGVPTPTLPPLPGPCTPEANITSPPTGIITSGPVTFFGTATSTNFASFDLQALGPQTGGQWISILESPVTQPILDGILGRFNFSTWLSGDYLVRVVVTNTAGEAVGQCGIQITIDGV
jgi:hypothetical protein